MIGETHDEKSLTEPALVGPSDELCAADAAVDATMSPQQVGGVCEACKRKKIPVVFVPGVMGSRLYFPGIQQEWDPDSEWAMSHWLTKGTDTVRRELHCNSAAEVIRIEDGLSAEEIAHGYGEVVKSYYVNILRVLQTRLFVAHVDVSVWAVGYDWRQSNSDSGRYLQRKVQEILAVEGASQVILVTHSMGGIVARSAMARGLRSSVLGVVHLFQPVDGAVAMYRRLFTGVTSEFDKGRMKKFKAWAFSIILGDSPEEYAATCSGLPGPLQLLPNNNYRAEDGGAWLLYEENGKNVSWKGDVYDLYRGKTNPPALEPQGLKRVVANDLHFYTLLAKYFHVALGRYKHPNTRSVHGTGENTDMATLFAPPKRPPPITLPVGSGDPFTGAHPVTVDAVWRFRGAKPQRRAHGDGTVPQTSANVLTPSEPVSNVEHADACNDAKVQQLTLNYIKIFLAFQ